MVETSDTPINMSSEPQNTTQIVTIPTPYTPRSSTRKSKLNPIKSISKPPYNTRKPNITSPTTQLKYKKMRAHIQTGFPIMFDEHFDVLELFCSVGWECLVSFDEVGVYTALLCEFYSNMVPARDSAVGDIAANFQTLQQQIASIHQRVVVPTEVQSFSAYSEEPLQDLNIPIEELQCSLNTQVTDFTDISNLDYLQPLSSTDITDMV